MEHATWYAARSAGLVAWCLLTASMVWGLVLTTGVLGRRPRKAWLLDLHRFLGAAALVFVGVHVVAIVTDSFVHFSVADVLVPFRASWHPVAVAWGIVAAWVLVAVEVTSLLRSQLPLRAWRYVHYSSFGVFALASLHGATAGTDRHTAAFIVLAFVGVGVVTGLTAVRVATLSERAVARTPAGPSSSRPVPAARVATSSATAPRSFHRADDELWAPRAPSPPGSGHRTP